MRIQFFSRMHLDQYNEPTCFNEERTSLGQVYELVEPLLVCVRYFLEQ
jgi:hypothetical protein